MNSIAQIQFSNRNNNYSNWIDELKIHENELKTCTHNLEKIVLKINNHPSALPKVEHFQNQFLINEANIHQLKAEVRRFNNWNAEVIGASEIKKNKKYRKFLKLKIERFRKVFDDLLSEFKSFFRNELLISYYTF